MRTKSMVRTAVLLVLSLGLGIVMGCNQGNNTPQQQGNTPGGNTGGGTTQGSLDGLVVSESEGYYYFSNNQVFYAWDANGTFKKRLVGSYSGTTFHEGSQSFTITINANYISFDNGVTMPIVTDPTLITKVKNAQEE